MKKYTITVNGTAYEVEVEEMGGVAAPKAAAPKAAPAAAFWTCCCAACMRARANFPPDAAAARCTRCTA